MDCPHINSQRGLNYLALDIRILHVSTWNKQIGGIGDRKNALPIIMAVLSKMSTATIETLIYNGNHDFIRPSLGHHLPYQHADSEDDADPKSTIYTLVSTGWFPTRHEYDISLDSQLEVVSAVIRD